MLKSLPEWITTVLNTYGMTGRTTGPVWQAGTPHIEQRPLFLSPHHMIMFPSTYPFTKATTGYIKGGNPFHEFHAKRDAFCVPVNLATAVHKTLICDI
jgi:hypothetical protein